LVGVAWDPRPRLSTGAPNMSSVHAGLSGSLTSAKVFFGNLAVVASFMFFRLSQRARRLCSPLAWGILASWMLWALKLQISTRSDRTKTPAILGLMRLNFLSVATQLKVATPPLANTARYDSLRADNSASRTTDTDGTIFGRRGGSDLDQRQQLNPIVMKAACLRLPVQPSVRSANAHSATHRRRLAMRAVPCTFQAVRTRRYKSCCRQHPRGLGAREGCCGAVKSADRWALLLRYVIDKIAPPLGPFRPSTSLPATG